MAFVLCVVEINNVALMCYLVLSLLCLLYGNKFHLLLNACCSIAYFFISVYLMLLGFIC